METFIILGAKEITARPQQLQGFVDRFSRPPWGGASRIRTRKNRHQRVLRWGTLRLRNAVRRKRPDLCAAENCDLHHNAPAHSLRLIQRLLAKHNIPLIRQAHYSPCMAPCDFWLFPKLKMQHKGTLRHPTLPGG